MAICPKCGVSAEGRFCPGCGFALDAGAPPIAAAPVTMSMPENLASALCYLLGFITGILFLILAPFNQNKTVRFHAFQSIFFNVAIIAMWIAFGILSSMFWRIPFLGFFMTTIISLCLSLGVFVAWLFLMWKAYNGEKFELPVIGPLAQKQA